MSRHVINIFRRSPFLEQTNLLLTQNTNLRLTKNSNCSAPLLCNSSFSMQSPTTSLAFQEHPYHNLHLLRQNALSQPQVACLSTRDQRVRFALFVKILFKRLDESGDHILCQKAKRLLLFVTARNKQGDPGCSPLTDALESRLRAMVGETHWRRSHLLMRIYLSRNGHVLPSYSRNYHKISYAA